jgi:hypothetical protein
MKRYFNISKNNVYIRLSILFISFCFTCNLIFGQNENFILLKNGKFYDGCEEFNPL